MVEGAVCRVQMQGVGLRVQSSGGPNGGAPPVRVEGFECQGQLFGLRDR